MNGRLHTHLSLFWVASCGLKHSVLKPNQVTVVPEVDQSNVELLHWHAMCSLEMLQRRLSPSAEDAKELVFPAIYVGATVSKMLTAVHLLTKPIRVLNDTETLVSVLRDKG